MAETPDFREITSGLQFPEGPIAMPDGSVILVEIARGTLSRVTPFGRIEIVADLGGSPNGAAIGPDGAVYVCNSGGYEWRNADGLLMPVGTPEDYAGGRIERVDLRTGAWSVLYSEVGGHRLAGPNDLVFDSHGGFYFTDPGKRHARHHDRGALYYAKADGSLIREVAYGLWTPNGVGLSPDGLTLYMAETVTARLWAYEIVEPGRIRAPESSQMWSGSVVASVPGNQMFDSLAVDAEGHVCVATVRNGGITRISPDGREVVHYPLPDAATTNICFGGPDLRTAYVTLSSTGKLASFTWPVPGLPLNYLNT
jgi:gluconolactonase